MSLDVSGIAQSAIQYSEYNKKAIETIANSDAENLDSNVEALGAFDFQKKEHTQQVFLILSLGR